MRVGLAACPAAGMNDRQVAERGQQKPGQPLAQVSEAQRPQAGFWTSTGTQGRQREGRATQSGKRHRDGMEMEIHTARDRDSEMGMDRERQGDRENKVEMKRQRGRWGWR